MTKFLKANKTAYYIEPLALLIFLVLCFALLFPDFFLLIRSPMGGSSTVLKDPSVSWSAFMPAFREFRYELLEHGNILWSNLRSLGLPLLGNAVQGAPLFPLNLALVWLPDNLYWSVMPIARIILIAWGLYLVCRHIFGLSILASLAFALLAGFNFNMIRWINHPWSNGVLAGIWYLYFCCSVLKNVKTAGSALIWNCLGLIVSVFAMVTCGFPEASALAAIFSMALFVGFVVTHWTKLKPSFLKGLGLLAVCHLIGFCLSAIQIFALLEFITISQALEMREGFISGVFMPDEAITASLAQFTPFWYSTKQLEYTNFHIGLFGLFFFTRGSLLWLKTANKPWLGLCCMAMMTLYIVKSFGLSSLVEHFFTATPVLAQSHFPLYFSPLFYFGAFYFCAIGVESTIQAYQGSNKDKYTDIAVSMLAATIVVSISFIAVEHFNKIETLDLTNLTFKQPLIHFHTFIICAGLLILSSILMLVVRHLNLGHSTGLPLVTGFLLITWLLIELNNTLPKDFSKTNHWRLNLENDYEQTFNQAATTAQLNKYELRGNEANGRYAGYGIATISNGISAIMPFDQRQIRMKLFSTLFTGYWPAEKSLKPWSWETLSSNLMMVDTSPRTKRQWLDINLDPEIRPINTSWNETLTKEKKTLFYLEGSTTGDFKNISGLLPWIHFKGSKSEFWVQGNIAGQQSLDKKGDRHTLLVNWRIRMPKQWLEEDRYQITVRIERESNGAYADTTPVSLNLLPQTEQNKEQFSPNKYADINDATLLASTPNEQLHLYLAPKALPRAYIARSCTQDDSNDQTMAFLTESDAVLNGEVSLASSDILPKQLCANYQGEFKRVPIESDVGSKMTLGKVTGPALVIVNDYDYPGWKAKDLISGEKLEIVKANSIFRAIYLPENKDYELKLNYHPWWLNWVYGLLVLAVLLMVASWRWLINDQR